LPRVTDSSFHANVGMRTSAALVIGLVGCTLAVGCKKPEGGTTGAPQTAPAAAKPGQPTVTKAPTFMKVDKVSKGDGPIAPDKENDAAILLVIEGPVAALAVVGVAEGGATDASTIWDTVAGDQKMNAAWQTGYDTGSGTHQLAVEEAGKPMNTKAGSLTPLGPGVHNLILYASDVSVFNSGRKFMVLAERPDHSVLKSNSFDM
jgi:hypothetical protein